MGEPRLVSDGVDPAVRYDISDGEHIVGRSPDADVVVSDHSVSRRHARIDRHGQHVVVVDLRSSNGTFVNGRRVEGRTGLAAGDVVRLGAVELRFESDADDTGPAPVGVGARFDVGRQSGEQIWNVGGDVRYSHTVVGEDDPWDELFQGTPAGRVLMALGLLAVIAGFALWMAFIFSGFAPPAGVDPFGWNPFTDGPRVLGVPRPVVGFALFLGGGVLAAMGSGLSRAQRRRRGEMVRPIRRARR